MSLKQLINRIRWQAGYYRHLLRSARSSHESADVPSCAVLEERILMSATPLAAAAPEVAAAAGASADGASNADFALENHLAAGDFATQEASMGENATGAERAHVQTASLEVVVVDESIEDVEQLLADLQQQSNGPRRFEVFTLDSDRDGVEQISEIVSRFDQIDALHIVTHGTDGAVRLGDLWLTSDNLSGYAGEFASWGRAMSAEADVLFYGCELAQSATGRELMQSIAVITGADVAASDDDTGHADLGGDWNLEFTFGQIDVDVAFSAQLQQSWVGLLATSETHYFLANQWIPGSDLELAIPTATSIPDYDSGRHAGAGTLVDKGGSGFGESDPVKHQYWQTINGNLTINGPVQLNLWSHIKDFNTTKGATVHAYLIDIRNNGSDAQLVATDSVTRSAWNPSGDWVYDTFDFGTINRSLAANRRLQVKVVVDGSSDDGMVFGYDSIFHRSHLVVGMTTSNGDPVLNNGGGPFNYSENDGPKEIGGGLSLTDDDANLQWATVQLTGNFNAAEDSLAFTDPLPPGVTMQADAATGQIVFYGAASVGDYEAVLKKISYTNSSEDPSELTRTVTFEVYDGQNLSTVTQTIDVTAVNDAPTVAPNAAGTGLEDQNLVYTHAQMLTLIGASDVDNTNSELTVNITGVNNASFSKAGSGSGTTYTFTLTQPAHSNGYNVTFNYEVVDPELANASAGPATIAIQSVNDEPGLTLGADQNVNEDTGAHTVNSFASATPGGGADESGQTFTYLVSNNNGSLFAVAPAIDAAGNLTYTLAADAFGSATVTVQVRDSGGTANGGDNTSGSQQFTINVANSNNDDAYVAANAGLAIDEDATKTITSAMLRVADVDLPAASSLVYTIVGPPTLGRVELTTNPGVAANSFTQEDIDLNRLRYVHAGAEAPLTDSFDFTATDGIGTPTANQTFNIAISSVNDAPVNSVPGAQSTMLNTPLTFESANSNLISISDADAGGSQMQVTLTATNGTASIVLPFTSATAVGGETVVPSNTGQSQHSPAVARSASGDYVVVWSGKGPGDADGIYFQRFDASHVAQGVQTRVNTTTTDAQNEPQVAMDAAGNFVVVWTSNLQDGNGTGVYARKFDNTGAALSGEVLVNTYIIGAQDQPDIAMDADGDFVVVWQSDGQDGHSEGVYGQLYNSSMTKVGTEFQVSTITAYKQYRPAVAMDADGDFVVAWEDSKADAGGPGIFVRRYDRTGTARDVLPVLANAISLKKQEFPDVAMDDAGNFVVVWTSQEQDTPTSRGIYGQLFSADGTKTGPAEFLVNTFVTGEQTDASVAMDADGDFVVTWESQNQDNPGDFLTGVYAQQFDSDAAKVGTELQVNTTVTGTQQTPQVAVDADGDFVVVWGGEGVGDLDGVFTQRYNLPAPPLTFTVGDGTADTTMTFRGTVADINSALDGMTFSPNTAFVGTATLQVVTNDLGNTGPGGAQTDDDTININVLAVNTNPTINSNGGGATAAVNITSGNTAVTTVTATDSDVPAQTLTYSISGGADALKFTINNATGALNFLLPPLFVLPTDANLDNVYEVEVQVSDGAGGTDTQAISVTVLAGNANPVITSDGGGASAAINVAENSTAVTTVTATDSDVPAQTLTYSIVGGADAARFAINSTSGALSFVNSPNFETPDDTDGNNIYQVSVAVSDGAGGSDTQNLNVSVTDDVSEVTGELWITTKGNGTANGVSWSDAEVVRFGNAGDHFDPTSGSTSGTLEKLPGFLTPADIRAVHYVESNVTVGTAPNAFVVNPGDLILTLDPGGGGATVILNAGDGDATNDITVDRQDLVVYRPNTIGDYSAGEYFMLLDSSVADATKTLNVHGIALVERDTIIGGTTLNSGTLIVAHANPDHQNLATLSITGTGTASSAALIENFLTGASLGNAADQIQGIHLIQQNTWFGSHQVSAGTILVQVNSTGTYGGQLHEAFDVLALSVTQTEQDATPGTSGTAILLFDGSEVDLQDATNEPINGLTVVSSSFPSSNTPPVVTSNGGGVTAAIDVAENSTAVTTVTATDADFPAQTLTYSISGGADAARFAINNTSGALMFVSAPDFEAPSDVGTDNVYDVQVTVSDGAGGTDVQDISVTVTDVGLLAYESFSYGAGNLQGANGGSGWATGWNLAAGSTALVNTTGLNDPTALLPTTGGTAEMNTSTQFEQTRELAQPLGTSGSTAWFSFLLKPDSIGSGGMSLRLGDLSGPGDYVTIGTSTDDFLLTRNASVFGAPRINNVVASGQTYLLTARIDFAAGADTVTLYVDPTPGLASPDSPGAMTAQLTTADLGSFTTVGMIGGFTGNNAQFDEIRVGETFLDVAPAAANTPPTITSNGGGASAAVNVAENSTVATTMTASDPEAPPQTLTWSITGGTDAARFAINSTTGALSFVAAPDFEAPTDANTDNVYHVTVQVSDGFGGTDAQNVSVTVTAANDNSPVITSNGGGATAAINVAENSTAVTTVTATDADLPAQTLSYGISGGADAARFAINGTTGVLTFVAAPNFEAPTDAGTNNIYDVQVTVSDGAGGTDVQDIAVTVTDQNEFAVSAVSDADAAVNQISEVTTSGSTVGITAAAVDNDGSTNAITFSLDDNAGGRFAINGSTGVVTVSNASLLDYEAATSHSITVRAASADGSLSTQSYFVAVLPVDDEAPVFTSPASVNHPENNPNVLTLAATDADDPATVITFTIVGGDDAARFNITGSDGLKLVPPRDFESPTDANSDNVYEVSIQASDGAGNVTVQNLAVTILDVNESPRITSNGAGATASVNVVDGTTAVTVVTATDPDLPPQTLSYAVTGGADAARFTINGGTGSLNFIALPSHASPTDADTDNVYHVTVQVSDGAGGTDTQAIAVTVVPSNVAPVGSVTISGTAAQNETLTAGHTLTDADGMGAISWQWRRNGVDIAGATASTYALTEADVGTLITVTASYTDGGGTNESVASTAVGPVANVNDLPTGSVTISGIATEDQMLTASETLADADGMGVISWQWLRDGSAIAGATANTYTLTDADVGTMISVAASWVDGHGTNEQVVSSAVGSVANLNDVPTGGVSISGLAIEDQTLTASNTLADADGLGVIGYQWLRNGSVITGATATTYTLGDADVGQLISVQASWVDGHGAAEAVVSSVIGPVANVNDAPVVTPLSGLTIDEDTAIGAVIAIATATDPDAGDTLAWSITDGNDDGHFAIAADGSLMLVGPLNFLETSEYRLRVTATDSGTPTLNGSTIVVVTVNRVVVPAPETETRPPEEKKKESSDDEAVETPVAPTATGTPAGEASTTSATGASNAGASPDQQPEVVVAPPAVVAVEDSGPIFVMPEISTHLADVVEARYGNGSTEFRRDVSDNQVPTTSVPGYELTFRSAELNQSLAQMKTELKATATTQYFTAATAVTTTSSLTVGYVLWAIRGGWLASSILAQMPAWRLIDPLVVLSSLDGASSAADDQSLQDMLEDGVREIESEEDA